MRGHRLRARLLSSPLKRSSVAPSAKDRITPCIIMTGVISGYTLTRKPRVDASGAAIKPGLVEPHYFGTAKPDPRTYSVCATFSESTTNQQAEFSTATSGNTHGDHSSAILR